MWDGWQQFFHAPVDLSSLALFRMLLGTLMVADAIISARNARWLLHPDSLVPFEVWKRGPERRFFSILRWLPATRGAVIAVIVLYGVSGSCLAVGFATRWAAAGAFLAGVSLHNRNRYVLHSGDAVLRILLFLLIFSDAGKVWSVDAWLASRPSEPGTPWALRLMQIQMALLYLFAVRFKLPGRTWRQGTATHYASNLLAHRRIRLPAWLDGIAAHKAATWSTLGVELAGGLLVWFPSTRWVVLAGLAGLHLTLQVLMRMHIFQWTMLAALVLFVPGEATAGLWVHLFP